MSEKEAKPSILIVDDTPQNIKVLGSVLKARGYVVSVAQNGEQALKIAANALPDIILLDIMMPGMDGFETMEKLKENPATADIPVIFLTAIVEKEAIAKGFDAGAVDYITKPFNSKELLARVETHVGMKLSREAILREKTKADEANKLKDKFISLVVHDLKTPFNSILGLLRVLQKDKERPLHDEQVKIVNSVISSGESMVNMIDQLLDISRLQMGKILPERRFALLRPLASMVLSGFEYQADQKGVVLVNELPKSMFVYTDTDLYAEVLNNLISNAIKFCSAGGKVTIFAKDEEKSLITVSDTGIGIDDYNLANLFKHEVKTTTKGTSGEKGTGLGLPLSQDIMKALGGGLFAETVKGKGSSFHVHIPYVRPLILIVDDIRLERNIMKTYLKHFEADLIYAQNGQEALDILDKKLPHLIIMDLNMPVMGGMEALGRIRQIPGARNIPVIILTGDDKAYTREEAFRQGANDFITKPLSTAELLPRVRRWIFMSMNK